GGIPGGAGARRGRWCRRARRGTWRGGRRCRGGRGSPGRGRSGVTCVLILPPGRRPGPARLAGMAPPPLTRDRVAAMIDHTLLSPDASRDDVAACVAEALDLRVKAV